MNSQTEFSAKDRRERISTILKGYVAFIAALLFLLLTNGDKWPRAWLPSTLFALSLPSLIAFELFAHRDPDLLESREDRFMLFAALLGVVPSLTGLCIVVGHIQRYAGIGFAVLSLFWLVVITLAGMGKMKN